MGCARRRLAEPASGARDVGGASGPPPIGRARRGIFILLFTPRTEKNGSPVRRSALSPSHPDGTRAPSCSHALSLCGSSAQERTLSFRDPLRSHAFPRERKESGVCVRARFFSVSSSSRTRRVFGSQVRVQVTTLLFPRGFP